MKERIIFHLPYKIDPNRPSASQIRPLKMIKGFIELGYDVDVIMGNSKERKILIDTIKKNIRDGIAYKFLYSESSTMPTLLTDPHHFPLRPCLDFSFFTFCRRNGIPIGLFYRDIHWVFSFNGKSTSLKTRISNIFYKYDVYQYNRLLDVLFLPSLEMSRYIPNLKIENLCELPPGLEMFEKVKSNDIFKSNNINILYVGGLSRDIYNIELLVREINKHPDITLTICCRVYDFEQLEESFKNDLLNTQNIKIVHKQGIDLIELYENSDLCCLFLKPIDYWNFAMPAKTFEYLSFLKPILAVKGTVVGSFVEKKNIGWSIDYSSDELNRFLNNIKTDTTNFSNIQRNAFIEREKHTWKMRAATVSENVLLKTNNYL